MRTDTSFHRRINPQGLVDPRKIVVHVPERNHGDGALDLLAEGVRQPGEARRIPILMFRCRRST